MTRRWADALVAAVLLVVATVLVTWPLLRHPATDILDSPSLYGPAAVLVQRDIFLTLWVLAWDSHALVTDPLRVFHANAFYPAPYSLALSEHMLGNVPLFAPPYLATGNPVLAHQASLVATFVLAGLAMAAYVFYWTNDRLAALAGGFFFAFAPYRLWQIGNLHVISIHLLPLVLLGIDLALDGRRRSGSTLLAASLALSTLCSYYVGYAAFALAGAYAAVAIAVRRRRDVRGIGAVAVGLGSAALLVGFVTLPYLILQENGVLPHRDRAADFKSMAFVSAAFGGPSRFASFFLQPRRDGIPQFLGYTVMALALAGLVLHRRMPRGALVAGGATGWLLGLGPYLLVPGGQIPLPYRWLMVIVPGFSAMRVPRRFGAIVTVVVAALAGLGLAALRARLAERGRHGLGVALVAAAVAIVLVEVRPVGLRTLSLPVGESMPPVYRWLAEHGEGGPLIEVPAFAKDLLGQSQAMYYSTAHWLPLANGYTPYAPKTHVDFMDAAAALPARDALDRMLGVAPLRWVLVNRRLVPPEQWPQWTATFAAAGLRQAVEFPQATVFEVPPMRRGTGRP